MDVKEAIRTRRSIKHYDPSHEMTEAEVQELMEHAILAPTAFNIGSRYLKLPGVRRK